MFLIAGLAIAVEYKTYDSEVFKVEYPADWTVDEQYFFNDPSSGDYAKVDVGLNGIDIYLYQNYASLSKTGYLNESTIHLLKTFQAKKVHGPKVRATEYKPYENEYFKVEIPVN